MTIKQFEFPNFEEAKHDIVTCRFVADYRLYICVANSITIEISAIAGYDETTIFEEILTGIDDIAVNKIKAWYDKAVKKAKEFWESYIIKSYFSEEEV